MANCSHAMTSEASQIATSSDLPLLKSSRDSCPRPMMIQHADRCPVCDNLDSRYRGMVTFSFYVSLEKLREGSDSSCVYCKIMLFSRKVYAMAMPHGANEVGISSKHMNPYSTRFCWHWPHGPMTHNSRGVEYFRDIQLQISLCQQARPWGRFQAWQGIPSSARSSETVSFYKDRLRECLSCHEKCQYEQERHPTRLLFVGDGAKSIKLIQTCNTDIDHYAALSHPWGTSQSLMLKSTNEASMNRSIAWDTFPQTYRDAIWVCQKLGINYLWIDSLCIKQDDSRDWHREAAKMADVYETALIVIAASCCSSTEDSFLNSRTPVTRGPAVVAWSDDDEPEPVLQIQKVPRTGFHLQQGKTTTDPLDMRAWAFQEKRLAQRLINFTNGEVQWTCKSACFCECPKAWENDRNLSGRIVPVTTEEWKDAVIEYSCLSLTYASDIPPALSGLATRFHQVHGVKYLADLWQNPQLVEQLAWYTETGQMDTENGNCPAYRAPTFSWASIHAGVAWHTVHERFYPHIQVRDAQCTLKSSNPFGEVSDGYISIRGRVVDLALHQPATKERQPFLCFANGDRLALHFYPDKPTGQNYFRRRMIAAGNKIRLQRSIQWLAKAEGVLPDCIPVLCLRICTSAMIGCDRFLVLVESSYIPGTYERIGLIWTSGKVAQGEEKRNLKQLLDHWESMPIEELIIV